MKLHLVKRVGMLAACAAAATVCAFGVASLNGLRYVRPTAENWTLLAYIEPAARVEQQVERSDGEYFATTLTGFDAQERRVWSLTSMHPFIVGYGDRAVYNGSEMTRYITGYGGYTTQHVQYDELGRTIQFESSYGTAVYTYRGEESEPYQEKWYNTQGEQMAESTFEHDSATGYTIQTTNTYEPYGTVGTDYTVTDRYGYVVYTGEALPDAANMPQGDGVYDTNENTLTRTIADGSTVKIWYDDEQRELRREQRNEDGSLSYYTVVEYTDVILADARKKELARIILKTQIMVDKREEQFHEENVGFRAARGGNDDRSRCGGRAECVGAVIGRCGARGRPRALAGGQRVRNADHP